MSNVLEAQLDVLFPNWKYSEISLENVLVIRQFCILQRYLNGAFYSPINIHTDILNFYTFKIYTAILTHRKGVALNR